MSNSIVQLAFGSKISVKQTTIRNMKVVYGYLKSLESRGVKHYSMRTFRVIGLRTGLNRRQVSYASILMAVQKNPLVCLSTRLMLVKIPRQGRKRKQHAHIVSLVVPGRNVVGAQRK